MLQILNSDRPKPPRNAGPPATVDSAEKRDLRPQDYRILLVEDDYFAAMVLENALLDAGYQVTSVLDNAEEAIVAIKSNPPHLVVCDIRLSGELDGLDVAEFATKRSVPFIVASAHTDAHTKFRGEKLEPDAWLVKPFGTSEFLTAVRNTFRRQRFQ